MVSKRRFQTVSSSVLAAACLAAAAEAGNPRFQESASPDGTHVAYVNASDGDSEIYVEKVDGTQQRRLTTNDDYDNDPTWSPDGKSIAFASDRGGLWQIYRFEFDSENLKAVTDDESGCIKPKYGPRGQLAYLAHRGRAFKRTLYDLMVQSGDNVTPIAQNLSVWEIAWHPKDDILACSTDGQIVLHDLQLGTSRTVTFADSDRRLGSFRAIDLHWNADTGELTGRLEFLGGLPQGLTLFGDGARFAVSAEGGFRLIESGQTSNS